MLREEVPWETTGPGCWDEDAIRLDSEAHLFTSNDRRRASSANTTCVDVSYKALVDSYDHYVERTLYTEMEMFVSVEFVLPLLSDWLDAQATLPVSDSLYCNHRYVAADDLPLSPQFNRDTVVFSFIVLGTKTSPADQDLFQQYASTLEALAKSYGGTPHWGKQNYAERADLEVFYDLDRLDDVRRGYDPDGIFLNDYLEARIL